MSEFVKRRIAGLPREFEILTTGEAFTRGLATVLWQDALPGEYGVSDDGYVAVCLSRKEYPNKQYGMKTILTYPYARVWVQKKTPLLYEPRRGGGMGYTATKPQKWGEREAKRRRTKDTVKVYVAQMLAGKVDYDVLGKVYRPDQLVPRATVKRLFKNESVKAMIDKELSVELSSRGITKWFVLDTIKAAIDMATEQQKPQIMLQAAAQLGEIIDIKPEKAKQSLRLEYAVTRELEADFQKAVEEVDAQVIESNNKRLAAEEAA